MKQKILFVPILAVMLLATGCETLKNYNDSELQQEFARTLAAEGVSFKIHDEVKGDPELAAQFLVFADYLDVLADSGVIDSDLIMRNLLEELPRLVEDAYHRERILFWSHSLINMYNAWRADVPELNTQRYRKAVRAIATGIRIGARGSSG